MPENKSVTPVIITAEAQKTMSTAIELAEKTIVIKTIENNEGYIKASDILKVIKTRSNELDELRKSLTRPLDESKAKIMELFKRPLNLLLEAESKLKSAMLKYQQEEERKRREAEAKLQAEQDRKEAALKAKIAKADAAGDTKKAEKLEIKLETVSNTEISVAPKIIKIEGVQTKKIWKYRIIDPDSIPRKYLMPNEKMLGDIARTCKGMVKVAGVEFYAEESLSQRI